MQSAVLHTMWLDTQMQSLSHTLAPYLKILQTIGLCPFSVSKNVHFTWPAVCYHVAISIVILTLTTFLWTYETTYTLTLSEGKTLDLVVWDVYYNSNVSMYADLLIMTVSYGTHFVHILLTIVDRNVHLHFVRSLFDVDSVIARQLRIDTSQLDENFGLKLIGAMLTQTVGATCVFYYPDWNRTLKICLAFVYGLKMGTVVVLTMYMRHLVTLITNRLVLVRFRFESVVLLRANTKKRRQFKRIVKLLNLLNKLFRVKWLYGRAFGRQLLAGAVLDFTMVSVSLFITIVNMRERQLLWFDFVCVLFSIFSAHFVKSAMVGQAMSCLAAQVIDAGFAGSLKYLNICITSKRV